MNKVKQAMIGIRLMAVDVDAVAANEGSWNTRKINQMFAQRWVDWSEACCEDEQLLYWYAP